MHCFPLFMRSRNNQLVFPCQTTARAHRRQTWCSEKTWQQKRFLIAGGVVMKTPLGFDGSSCDSFCSLSFRTYTCSKCDIDRVAGSEFKVGVTKSQPPLLCKDNTPLPPVTTLAHTEEKRAIRSDGPDNLPGTLLTKPKRGTPSSLIASKSTQRAA